MERKDERDAFCYLANGANLARRDGPPIDLNVLAGELIFSKKSIFVSAWSLSLSPVFGMYFNNDLRMLSIRYTGALNLYGYSVD